MNKQEATPEMQPPKKTEGDLEKIDAARNDAPFPANVALSGRQAQLAKVLSKAQLYVRADDAEDETP